MLQEAETAVRIEEARKALKFILGDRYDSRVAPWRVCIREICGKAKVNGNPLAAAMIMMEAPGFPNGAEIYALSAAADVCEE